MSHATEVGRLADIGARPLDGYIGQRLVLSATTVTNTVDKCTYVWGSHCRPFTCWMQSLHFPPAPVQRTEHLRVHYPCLLVG